MAVVSHRKVVPPPIKVVKAVKVAKTRLERPRDSYPKHAKSLTDDQMARREWFLGKVWMVAIAACLFFSAMIVLMLGIQ